VTVEILSYAAPAVVAALWICARLHGAPGFIPLLFAALVLAALLALPAAQGPQPLAPCALVVAMAIAGLALVDLLRRGLPPGQGEDGDDHGGGGGRRLPRAPIHPRGGAPHPDSWAAFEQAFWAHVGTVGRERAGEDALRERRRVTEPGRLQGRR
jgi:hypothetical protein